MRKSASFPLFVVFAAALGSSPLHADDDADYAKFIEAHADAYVTVKFVLKMKMGGAFGGGDSESEQEITGVMIDAKGLVLCGSSQLGGGMMSRLSRYFGDSQATPTDLKVLIGDDTEGVEAELIARDSELELAWVQIRKPAEKPYAAIDLSKSARPKLGQRIVSLSRLGKYYGRAAVVQSGRIAGVCRKPRELYVPEGGASVGLPVFAASGALIGVAVTQMPEASDSDDPMSMLSSLSDLQGMSSGFVLPAEEVLKATARARESAKEAKSEPESATPKRNADDAPPKRSGD